MDAGPSCPLKLGTLDSPDYWTDIALMSAVRPLNAQELHDISAGSEKTEKLKRGVIHRD